MPNRPVPEQLTTHVRSPAGPIVGFDPEAMPVLGVGLGLTGLALGLRPRLSPLPLALTALATLMYRNPRRRTPDDATALFAVSDGTVLAIDEVYEHRFLHTDALRIVTVRSPFDVPVQRSPVAGTVRYVEHVAAGYGSIHNLAAGEHNTRTYIGIHTAWGPVLVVQVAGPLARQIVSTVQPDDRVQAGTRLGNARFGARTDLYIQRDTLKPLVQQGTTLTAGSTRLGQLMPL